MRFRVLGPLHVFRDDVPLPLGGISRRATLGHLLLHANTVVSTGQLLRALWGEEPPPTARKILQNAVSGLRRALGDGISRQGAQVLVTHAPGYVLRADPAAIDLCEFRELSGRGQRALALGQWDEAEGHLRRALELWRGPALADLAAGGYDWPELTALENERFAVLENRMEAALAAGRHLAVLGELEAVVSAEPRRERLSRQLMLALYRAGRQADALEVYRRTRTALVEELGLDPSPELRELERAILDHDPGLASSGGPPRRPSSGRQPVIGRRPGGPPAQDPAAGSDDGPPGRPAPGTAARHGSAPPDGETASQRGPLGPVGSAAGSPGGTAELRRVTALFVRADVVDAGTPPEVAERLLEEVRSLVRDHAAGLGGRPQGCLGPVALCVFGAARTREDDALRAVRAALRIAGHADPEVRLRVAVTSGEVLVAPVSGPPGGSQDAEVTGPLPGTWLDLLFDAVPGTVRICDATRALTAGQVRCQASGTPAGGHDVLVPLPAGDTRRAGPPFAGRERELRQLDWWARQAARDRRPHLVTVLGEAGIGRTRLVREFERLLSAEAGPRCLLGHRAPEPEDPYAPLVDVVRAYAGVAEEDDALRQDRALRAAVTGLTGTGRTSERLAEGLRRLLAPPADAGRRPPPAGDGAGLAAWRRLVEELAVREPLVVVLEDLHRADDTLLRLVGELPETVGDLPLLVVVTARPELADRAAYWTGGRRNATTLTLDPLPREAVDALLGDLLPGPADRRTARTHAALAEQAGGNPLFLTEYARALAAGPQPVLPRRDADARRPDGAVPVPALVHHVVSARIDTLPAAERALLYDASVFGGRFLDREIAALSDPEERHGPARVREPLTALERRGFLRRCRRCPELDAVEYEFAHGIVGEVAYSRLPHAVRAAKHLQAARRLTRRPTRAPAVLAHHCRRAVQHMTAARGPVGDVSAEACALLVRAGRLAHERGATDAARYCLGVARELSPTGEARLLLPLHGPDEEKSPA
ncbi:BTAD domain-containing putative transcriptional regulator [Streptomyces sp. NPDC048106]|uniref:BTAD domain-containing putative transcriptional regulator n=1 Tax=Streptomyces sp. NPDC048106 TaxID=3155750 RepID=UPI003451454F